MLFVVTAIWIVATVMTFLNERQGLGCFSVLLGGALVYGLFAGMIGYLGMAALGILTLVLVLVNKFDSF